MNEAYAGFRAQSLGKRTYAVTYALTAPAFKISEPLDLGLPRPLLN
jgi:hypothetical protein